jgi:hypothetical protein
VGGRSFVDEAGKKVVPQARTPYYDMFMEGARTDPRPLWHIQVHPHPKLGIDFERPYVRTSDRAVKRAKRAWRGVDISGNMESRFLYSVLTGSELVPFGYLETPIAVLPIEPTTEGYRIIDADEARQRGFVGLSEWLAKVENIWKRKLGGKAKRMSVYKWLDYWHQLTSQSPKKRFRVVYPGPSATYLVSAVVDTTRATASSRGIEGRRPKLSGLVVDVALFFYQTNNEEEAHYLVATLNSPYLDELIKPLQSTGQFGPRNIHKKPLEFPIPLYDAGNPAHRKLAELSKVCHRKVATVLPALAQKYHSVGKIRSEIKKELRDEIEQIDKLTKQLLR